MSKISGQFQDICEISGQLGALHMRSHNVACHVTNEPPHSGYCNYVKLCTFYTVTELEENYRIFKGTVSHIRGLSRP